MKVLTLTLALAFTGLSAQACPLLGDGTSPARNTASNPNVIQTRVAGALGGTVSTQTPSRRVVSPTRGAI